MNGFASIALDYSISSAKKESEKINSLKLPLFWSLLSKVRVFETWSLSFFALCEATITKFCQNLLFLLSLYYLHSFAE